MISSWLPTLPKAGEDQFEWSVRAATPTASSPNSSPVFLSSMIRQGALGLGMVVWVQSTPFEVVTTSLSPAISGPQTVMLWGKTPNSWRMSKRQNRSLAGSVASALGSAFDDIL